jgi:molybdopterin synthase catalytic subunit
LFARRWLESGGMQDHRADLLIRVTKEPLDPGEALRFVADPAAGGTVLFSGTVRDHSDAGAVTGLDYEAWEERANRLLGAIGDELLAAWPIRKAALLHRVGRLSVGEISVLVCCSAPHRAEAFEAARHGIERIKQDVPIWKKEGLVSGDAHWVAGS